MDAFVATCLKIPRKQRHTAKGAVDAASSRVWVHRRRGTEGAFLRYRPSAQQLLPFVGFSGGGDCNRSSTKTIAACGRYPSRRDTLASAAVQPDVREREAGIDQAGNPVTRCGAGVGTTPPAAGAMIKPCSLPLRLPRKHFECIVKRLALATRIYSAGPNGATDLGDVSVNRQCFLRSYFASNLA